MGKKWEDTVASMSGETEKEAQARVAKESEAQAKRTAADDEAAAAKLLESLKKKG